MSEHNVALIVHTCDRYAFLYKGFGIFFSRYWDNAANCNYYFATETSDFYFGNFQNIQSGKGEWADRLAFVLREKIREKYILYFQEDMWLTRPTQASFFNQLFELAEKNDWQQVKLHSSNTYITEPGNLFINGFQIATLDNARSGFLMSHQVTLWNKDFLLAQLCKNEHPWRNERRGTQRLKKLNPQIRQADYFSENGKPENNRNKAGALGSAYQTVSVNGTLGSPVQFYIGELLNNPAHQQHMEYGLQLQHNYQQQLTHDGLAKPRKTDIFKRIKNLIRSK